MPCLSTVEAFFHKNVCTMYKKLVTITKKLDMGVF